jgi:predicted transcriptional regulator
MPPTTSHIHITIVLATTALIAVIGVSVLSAALLLDIKPDTSLLTVYVGIISSAATGLIALLANTRTQKNDEPAKTEIVNKPEDPIPTKNQ